MRHTLPTLAGAAAAATILAACGGGSSTGSATPKGCSPIVSSVTVEAQDRLTFDSDAYRANAGCIEIRYRNGGKVGHTLLVKGQAGFKLAIGDQDTGTIKLPAGTYTLYCDIAGHEAAGMTATLTVA